MEQKSVFTVQLTRMANQVVDNGRFGGNAHGGRSCVVVLMSWRKLLEERDGGALRVRLTHELKLMEIVF